MPRTSSAEAVRQIHPGGGRSLQPRQVDADRPRCAGADRIPLDEPAAADVERELRDETTAVSISAINLAEVVDVMARIYRRTPAETLDALALLESGDSGRRGLTPTSTRCRCAARPRYERRTSPLSMADCVALATARALEEPLATSDPALAAAAKASGVPIIKLPDARGQRPD